MLKEARQRLLLYNKNYAKALDDEDIMEISISSSLYDNMRVEEFNYMEQAKKYLLRGKHTMKEVCFLVGYKDPNYFSRIFKRIVGMPPREYVKHQQREGL